MGVLQNERFLRHGPQTSIKIAFPSAYPRKFHARGCAGQGAGRSGWGCGCSLASRRDSACSWGSDVGPRGVG